MSHKPKPVSRLTRKNAHGANPRETRGMAAATGRWPPALLLVKGGQLAQARVQKSLTARGGDPPQS